MMNRFIYMTLIYLTLFFTLPLHFGCGSTKAMIKLDTEKPLLKKKIMVFPPIDLSGLPAGKAAQATEKLVDVLKQSPQVLIYAPPKDMILPAEVGTPEYGVTSYHPETIKTAKQMNMNAVMTVFLPPIEHSKARAGIWPFRYDIDTFKVSIIVNALNITNGCLYLTDFTTEKVAIASKEMDGLTDPEILGRGLDVALPRILAHQSAALINKLEEKPWTGRILEENEGTLTINAGTNVGVYPNQIFSVYSDGEKIVCRTGRAVDMLGEKIGRIKAVTVTEEYTLAHPESGGPFQPGQTVLYTSN